MSQGPIPTTQVPYQGTKNYLNISTATLVKSSPGRIMTISVTATASAESVTVYDAASTGAAATANIVYVSAANPALGTVIVLDFPCLNGIVVTPGTGVVVSVSYL